MDTLRSFKRCGAEGVYRQMSCRGITSQSAVLYRLLTQTIDRYQNRMLDKKKQSSNLHTKKTSVVTQIR